VSESMKDAAPLERAPRPRGGFLNKKGMATLGLGAAGVVALAGWIFTIRGEDAAEVRVSDVQPAQLNVDEARPPSPGPTLDQQTMDQATTGKETTTSAGTGQEAKTRRKGPPENWKRASVIVMRRGAVQQGSQGAMAGAQGGRGPGGRVGYSNNQGDDGDGDRRNVGRDSKMDFYAGGGMANARDLDVAGELLPEAEGCVIKAGTQITLQNRSTVRTSLPQRILGYVVNPVEGNRYLGSGRVSRCLAIPAGSTILSEVNAAGVETGDLRIQACALRLDLLGGGRRRLGCQPAHGADGGAGIEAETDYAVGGIITGILVEAALSTVRGLGGLVSGVPGVAVQVGTGMVGDVGSEYVRRELMRPPLLTMKAGAIYGVQLHGDLALPLND
jgi:hypothetical protein